MNFEHELCVLPCDNMPIEKQIAVLPGDGIGEEVVAETIKVPFQLVRKYSAQTTLPGARRYLREVRSYPQLHKVRYRRSWF